ncbi:MAG: o-succinylbenzoate synthase [Candidatus Marinamargulisbacteria bacterium]
MIKFNQVTFRIIELPLVTPFETSSARIDNKRLLLLEFIDQNGTQIFSECVAKQIPNYTPETVDTAHVVLKKHILPLVLGQSFDHPTHVVEKIQAHVRGNLMAVASVDMAAWALHATQLGVSLSQAIGGTKSAIECGISLGIQSSPEALASLVQEEAALGYKKIKCKIKPGKDIAFVEKVREVCGDGIPLMVDANNAYHLSDIDALKAMDTMGLVMMEQPLAWDDIAMHAKLQPQLNTPVCLDESIFHAEHARVAIDLGATQIINIKPGRVGGITESIKIHDVCQANNIPVWCGGMLETGIGRAYNVALASKANFTIPGDTSPSHRYWAQDIVTPEWTMSNDGMMQVPTGPGLGVDIDVDRIESLTIEKETVTA